MEVPFSLQVLNFFCIELSDYFATTVMDELLCSFQSNNNETVNV